MPEFIQCVDCRHCLRVYDEFYTQAERGVCTLLCRMVAQVSTRECPSFKPRVPTVPYIPREQAHRLLDEMLVKEIRLAMLQVEELLKALELQPRVRLGDDTKYGRFVSRPGAPPAS